MIELYQHDLVLFGAADYALLSLLVGGVETMLSTLMIAVVTIGVITASLVTKRAMMRQKQDEMAAVRAE